jgi:hypothetical protein
MNMRVFSRVTGFLRNLHSDEPKMKLESGQGAPNMEHIVNFVEFTLKRGLEGKLDLLDLMMAIDAHYLLELNLTYEDELINFYNNKQCEDGTWNSGKTHYVPNTAHILMFYDRVGAHPKIPLDSFLSNIDTWDKVLLHATKYDKYNFWGGIWGYVYAYVVYKKQRPPWTNDFLQHIRDHFESWAYDNHQRDRVGSMLYALCEEIPKLKEVINITIQQQNADGGWGFSRKDSSNAKEVVQTIWFLKTFKSPNVDVEATVQKATNYILRNYKTMTYQNIKLGGFSLKTDAKKLDIRSTTHALQILTGKYDALSGLKVCSNSVS